MLFDSEMGQEGRNFPLTHFEGVAFAMKENKAPDPLKVNRFGTLTVVANPKGE